MKELQALDTWAQAQIDSISAVMRRVITSHDAFAYFGANCADALSAADPLFVALQFTGNHSGHHVRHVGAHLDVDADDARI